ncbi:hypothetical protein AQUCO_00200750v1 [Aquilegia coerulea]|uniref:C2H2-type domain-containing protein n=1 Tax=Aquilegia coerulea TaxID=218851 RepID=A0A2G5F4J9_AQUCA|nr:hypothetical protein AQUCO_00200750v1 [Aquilegia coerulea]
MGFENFRADYGNPSGSCSTQSMNQEHILLDERLRENVMPLELAIKRELDYRVRMENLQARICADSNEAFVPSQGLPLVPSPSIVGKKRKTLSNNLRFFPAQPPRSSNRGHSAQHEQGKLLCTLCQVTFSSKSALRQHRQDSLHKANLMENQKKNRQSKNKPQWCKLCRISCSDERAFTQHLAGKKHAASVHAIEAAKSIKETEKKVLTVKWDELEWDTVG